MGEFSMESNTSRFQWTINERTKRNKTIDYFVDIGVYMVLICNFFILWGNSQDINVIVSWPTRLMVSYIFLLAIYLFITKVTSNKAELMNVYNEYASLHSNGTFMTCLSTKKKMVC